MFNNVFISYATEDFQYAENLHEFLESNGFQPWMDKKNLLPGQRWDYIIQQELRKADFIVLLLSDISVSKRGYVQKEFNQALIYCEEKLDSDIFIIPILINPCVIPPKLSKFQWIEYSSFDLFPKILTSIKLQRVKLLEETKQNKASMLGFNYNIKKTSGKYGENSPTQIYDLEFPLFINSGIDSLHEINILIENDIINCLKRARSNYFDNLFELSPIVEVETLMNEDSSVFGQISFQNLSPNFISYTSFTSSYTTGAAHGNYWTKGFNYYINPLRDFDLKTIFIDFSKAIITLRDLVHIKLMEKAKDEFEILTPSEFYLYKDMLEATQENFQNYYFKNNSIVFIYNTYQLTAFSLGDHHIEVTFDELLFHFPVEKKLIEFVRIIKNN